MPRKRSNTSYTLQALPAGLVVAETDALYINFRAESLVAAKAQAMIYLRNEAFLKGIRGVKLLRNNAEVWLWHKGEEDSGVDGEGK